MAVLQTENEIFLQLIRAVNKLEDLLIAFHTKCLEKDEDRDKFSKTTRANINSSVFDQHFAHCLGINRVRDNSCYDCIQLRVSFNQNTIFDHLLLNQNDFLSSIDNKVSPWVVWTLLQSCQLFFILTLKVASTTSDHDRHSSNFNIFSFLNNISDEMVLEIHAE